MWHEKENKWRVGVFLCSVFNGFWQCWKAGTTWKVGHDSNQTEAKTKERNTQNKNLNCQRTFEKKKNMPHNPAEWSNTSPYYLQRSSMLLQQKYIKLSPAWACPLQTLKTSLQPPLSVLPTTKTEERSGVDLTPHIKGCSMYFLKSNYESERNASRVGWGAIFPAYKLFGCLVLSHKIPQFHPDKMPIC